jgi:putative heme utilization carrier protein HutX
MTIEAAQGEQRVPLAGAARAQCRRDPRADRPRVRRITLEVVHNLLHERRTVIDGKWLAEIMQDVTTWGDILFIVHTPDIVLECSGPLPPGTCGRGYYNVHGESPIGGHIRAENCTAIAFVSRPFMGRPSRSIQFFNASGEAMFKIFVRLDDKRELVADQVAKFDALRERRHGMARGHN